MTTNDYAGKDKAKKFWASLARNASACSRQIGAALATAVVLHLTYMFFSDYIAPPPDLIGQWKFTEQYDDTEYTRFKNLQVTYQVLLLQDGTRFSGGGEKVSERGPTQDPVHYIGDKRTNIDVTGTINHNYFSGDTLVVQYNESGRRRASSTIHRLALCGPHIMCGCFRSTIADTSGRVWWQRGQELMDIYQPVEEPLICGRIDCSAAEIECGSK